MRTQHFTCMLLLCLAVSTLCTAQTDTDSLPAAEQLISWDDFVQSLYEDGTDYDEDVIEDLYDIHCNRSEKSH